MAQAASTRETEVLNELLTLTCDSIRGYREAAAVTDDRALQRCFLRRAADRQHIADQLCEAIESLGGEPAHHVTMLATTQRVFLNLCELLNIGSSTAMHEVARGESFLRSRYERALRSGVLSEPAREVVRLAYGSVWSGMRTAHGIDPARIARPQAM